jgi:hypothetical protein
MWFPFLPLANTKIQSMQPADIIKFGSQELFSKRQNQGANNQES